MTTELSISDSTLFDLDWFKSIDRILKRAKFDNYYDLYQYDDHGYILGPGSIRGFSFAVSANNLKCQMEEFASITDWQLLYTLIKDLITEGRGLIFLNGKQDSLINLTNKDASNKYLEHMRQAIIDSREKLTQTDSDILEINVNDFTIKLNLEKLTKDLENNHELWDSLEKTLISQVKKLGPLHHAKVEILRTPDANLKLVNYHHLPTIITKEADYISMKGITKSLEGLVPIDDFRQILKNKIKDLKVSYYIPEINFHEETKLYEALKQVQIAYPKEISEEEFREEEDAVDEANEELWEQSANQVIDLFQQGKNIGEITLSICSNKETSEAEKAVEHATMEAFKLIAKNKQLTSTPQELKKELMSKNFTEAICDSVIKNIFKRMKEIVPEKEPSELKNIDEGGWLILASFIAISVIGALLLIVKAL
ncbi:MAG: hypothetical protein MK132_00900 [Lentisphaerales bacterium]|nr:hypothetical protein [Lentisphaerales bacterium]